MCQEREYSSLILALNIHLASRARRREEHRARRARRGSGTREE
jgi:hypothetical protein